MMSYNKIRGEDYFSSEKCIDRGVKASVHSVRSKWKWKPTRDGRCQVTHVTDLMFIMFLCLFNNQIVSVAHSRVTFWLPPRCEPV